jgi:hypothetical protein
MRNAYTRLGRLEYSRSTGKHETRIRVHLERFIGDGTETDVKTAHLLSLFGDDQEIGAISAAVHEKHSFEVVFPDESRKTVNLGADASCYRGSIHLKGRTTRSLRHLVAVSSTLRGNGGGGSVILFNLDNESRELAWTTIVSLLGIPADPRWGSPILEALYKDQKMRKLEGLNCTPYQVTCNKADLMKRLGKMLKTHDLPFPARNGPVLWPGYSMHGLLSQISSSQTSQAPTAEEAA